MSPLQSAKLWLMNLTGLSKDALHVYVGLAVFLGMALIFRLPLRDWRPLAAAFLAAIVGEIWDVIDRLRPDRDPLWASNWHDLWNTMFWPTMIFLIVRLLPGRLKT